MTEPVRVLYVGGQRGPASAATALDGAEQFELATVTDAAAALDRLGAGFDCVVSAYELGDTDGVALLEQVRESRPSLPVVLYPETGDEMIASEAVAAGVTEYLPNSGNHERLAARIVEAVDAHRERQAAERTETRLRELAAKTDDVLWTVTPEWDEILFVNDAVADLFGISPEQLRAEPRAFLHSIVSADQPKVVRAMEQLSNGNPVEIEYRLGASDTHRWVWTKAEPVVGEDGTLDRIVGFTREITDRKARETRLRQTTARLQVLFENSPDMITVHDTAGNLIDPNPRLCEETGYDESELTEMKVWDLNVELTPQQATARWAEMETGDRHRIEGIYRRKDGSTFPVEAHVRRLSLEGEDRFVVISRDITERTAREQALEAQNERLDEFASIVSHDLRNPLNVAGLRVELASEEFDSDHLEMASDALDRMDGLIEDLLTLARSGDELDVERVSLDEVAHACWTVVETGDANLVVETDRSIRAHEGTLRQLLENLFRNSVEHGSTTPGSQAREDTEPATPDRLARPDASSGADAAPLTRSAAADEQAGSGPTSRDGTGDAVTITVGALDDGFYVEDDGPGIPPDLRDRVFESGYSGEGGTGLGLNIVKRIADAHGWSVRATESAAGGARFEIAGVESGGDDV